MKQQLQGRMKKITTAVINLQKVVNTTTTTTTTALDRLQNRVRNNPVRNQSQNRLATKSVQKSAGSRKVRTNSVQKIQPIQKENLPHSTGTQDS
jgi:hypothetical protein